MYPRRTGATVTASSLLLQPRRSWRLSAFIGLTHALTLVVILMLPLDLITIILATAVVISAGLALRQHVFCSTPSSLQTALMLADGRWLLTWQSGATCAATLSAATFISQPLLVLNFQMGWRRAALPLFSDALEPEVLRQLRVRLKVVVG